MMIRQGLGGAVLLVLATGGMAAPGAGVSERDFAARAKARIMALDTDRDGRVSRAEWDAGRHPRMKAPAAPKDLGDGRPRPLITPPPRDLGGGRPGMARFDRIDGDHDGRITREEWGKRPRGGQHRRGRGGMAFERFDADRDGFLDAGEIDALTKRRFARLDRDHDGKLQTTDRPGGQTKRDD